MEIELGCDLMSRLNIMAPSTNNGEPDITQCLTEVHIDTLAKSVQPVTKGVCIHNLGTKTHVGINPFLVQLMYFYSLLKQD